MVYTTEEVEEIVTEYEVKVKNYEDKLHRLKADKRKVEMEKEMLEQKISKLQKSREDPVGLMDLFSDSDDGSGATTDGIDHSGPPGPPDPSAGQTGQLRPPLVAQPPLDGGVDSQLMQKGITDDGKVSWRCAVCEFSHNDKAKTRKHIKSNHLKKPKVELDAAEPEPPCRQRPAKKWRLPIWHPGAVVEPQVEEAVAVPVPVAVAEPEPDSELTTVTSSLTFQGIKIPDFTEMEIDSDSDTMSVLKRASEETPTEVFGSEGKSTADTRTPVAVTVKDLVSEIIDSVLEDVIAFKTSIDGERVETECKEKDETIVNNNSEPYRGKFPPK